MLVLRSENFSAVPGVLSREADDDAPEQEQIDGDEQFEGERLFHSAFRLKLSRHAEPEAKVLQVFGIVSSGPTTLSLADSLREVNRSPALPRDLNANTT